MMQAAICSLGISSEHDVVTVRQRAREISALLGFGAQDQVRIATAVSELARIAFTFASGGRVDFAAFDAGAQQSLHIAIKSNGGETRTGLSVSDGERLATLDSALISAGRLMDACEFSDERGVIAIQLQKKLPSDVRLTTSTLDRITRKISDGPVTSSYAEVRLQNKELLDTLAELRAKQDALLALTQELEDTNRGVVALYAEIEEKAERLREADALKSRFLSNTSHELRTPLSSIRALSQLLLDRIDGSLTDEQEKQIRFIEQAATSLSDLVNDLLDLAKIEAGKIEADCSVFQVSELFSTLRGMLRPLAKNAEVDLIFEDPAEDLELYTDEGKVSQILRNFVSNALKFTERGAVAIRAERVGGAAQATAYEASIRFDVIDSGIGIAPENLQFVFEEFSQVESPLQRRHKGTGLGLPLCRKLAGYLGGSVELHSEVNRGSTFSLILPMQYTAPSVDHQEGIPK
ncbi:MAG TPA: sensor histidine kinase [Herbaspirillum sp.]|jgi:signal transduction histidine kinase